MKENNSLQALINPGEAEDFLEFNALPVFEPTVTARYSPANALWLAEFSRLVYRREIDEIETRPPDFRTRNQILTSYGWREERADFFNFGNTQAALLMNANLRCAVLVFRGTLGLGHLITDSKLLPVDWVPGAGKVHVGFRDALQKVWNPIESRLMGFPDPVFYTGHSLGAALASLAAARAVVEGRIPRPAVLYTFGSPRVGDETFARTMRSVYHCRVVNNNDLVATLPTPPLFRHDGELHHLTSKGRIEVHPRETDGPTLMRPGLLVERAAKTLNELVANATAFGLKLPEELVDHAPVNYSARLGAVGQFV